MPTRRAFLLSTLAALAAMASPRKSAASGVLPDDLWLNRLTFGATDVARAEVRAIGRTGWLEAQLAMGPGDAGLQERLDKTVLRIASDAGMDENGTWDAFEEFRPLTALAADPADLVPLLDWERAMPYAERVRPGEEVIAASLIRAVHAPAQLREVMTQFWHDHFNVHALKDEFVSVFFPAYDAGLRDLALGRFRDLLGHVAKSPSMLIYLTNDESRASPANENFARELLELHTLGAGVYWNDLYSRWDEVPGAKEGLAQGYTDDDVWEVARCFTGWTVGDGRYLAEGQNTPKTGRFTYVEGWHDPYQKRILGREFAPQRAPMADGEEVLDTLATHPATARFISEKLARRLLADDPDPALVDRLAAVFLAQADAPDQMAQVIRALVAEPAFSDTPPTKLRRPFEYLAAILRATRAEVDSPEMGWHWELVRAGWMQHIYPPPTGHPDRTEDWSSGVVLLRMAELALYAQEEWMKWTKGTLADRLPDQVRTVAAMADHWGTLMTGTPIPPEALATVQLDPAWEPAAEERASISAGLIAAAALSPEFLFR